MSEQAPHPTVLFLGGAPERAAGLQRVLEGQALVSAERGFEGVSLAVARAKPRAVIIDLSAGVEAALRAMDELHQAIPGLPLIALAGRKDPELILRAMRSGAREFVVQGDEGELAKVVRSLFTRSNQEQPPGTIISLFPSNGGVGATTLATNLAGALLEGGKRVALIDLDLQLGDVLIFLDLAPRFTALEVLSNVKRLDRDLLHASLATHASGVQVVAQSDRVEDSEQLDPEQVRELLRFLARSFDYLVVDGLRGFDETSIAALDVSDRVLLALTQNVPSMKNAHRCQQVFRRLGLGEEKTGLVINRYRKSEAIDLQAIADNLGQVPTGVVSNDYPAVISAINRGVLLAQAAPRAKVSEDLRRLGAALAGRPAAKGEGFWRGLFAGKSAPKKLTPSLAEE